MNRPMYGNTNVSQASVIDQVSSIPTIGGNAPQLSKPLLGNNTSQVSLNDQVSSIPTLGQSTIPAALNNPTDSYIPTLGGGRRPNRFVA